MNPRQQLSSPFSSARLSPWSTAQAVSCHPAEKGGSGEIRNAQAANAQTREHKHTHKVTNTKSQTQSHNHTEKQTHTNILSQRSMISYGLVLGEEIS